MEPIPFIWTIISFILTIMVFSYIIGDNPLFRIATYLFIGVSTGYVSFIVIQQILVPKLLNPVLSGDINQITLAIIPLIFCILLIFKLSPRFSRLGTLPIAFLVGVGSAVIITGAILGTIFPQIEATISGFGRAPNNQEINNFFSSFLILIGTTSTLVYFQFSVKNNHEENSFINIFRVIRIIGKVFIGITLGATFAGVILSALVALIERIDFILQFIFSFFIG